MNKINKAVPIHTVKFTFMHTIKLHVTLFCKIFRMHQGEDTYR